MKHWQNIDNTTIDRTGLRAILSIQYLPILFADRMQRRGVYFWDNLFWYLYTYFYVILQREEKSYSTETTVMVTKRRKRRVLGGIQRQEYSGTRWVVYKANIIEQYTTKTRVERYALEKKKKCLAKQQAIFQHFSIARSLRQQARVTRREAASNRGAVWSIMPSISRIGYCNQ